MRAVRVVVGVALLVVVVVLLFVVLNWYAGPKTPSVRKDLVVAVAQILGGTALLSGLYFTWRTLQVNREGQITERFTRAIDQLGKVEDGQKLFEIRIGGIYALERIARESEEDYWPIMEVLTTYVRQNTSRITKKGQEVTDDATEKQSAMDSSGEESGAIEPPAPDSDIQVIMTVLGRHTRFFEPGEPAKMILDLHNANLSRVDLGEADLFGVNLRGADLSYANLSNAVLRANLSHADLRRADLSYVTVIQAEGLCEADLRGADLSYADLRRAEGITAEQLEQQAKCLKGAIMPDGSRHP